MHDGNVLVQPGPLSMPFSERTMKDPSFRIIDFGNSVIGEKLSERETEEGQLSDLYWLHEMLGLPQDWF